MSCGHAARRARRTSTRTDRSLIEHSAGEETQWDWLELPDPPQQWGCEGPAHLLLGVLAHSSRWRGWIAECEDQPHLIEGLHQVATRLGGLTQRWRFDRMATVWSCFAQGLRPPSVRRSDHPDTRDQQPNAGGLFRGLLDAGVRL